MPAKDAYRDELEAARARIEALAEELAGRVAKDGEQAGEVSELERKRQRAVDAGDTKRIFRGSAIFAAVVFLGLAAVFVIPDLAAGHGFAPALLMFPLAFATVFGLLSGFAFKAGARQTLALAEKQLKEARRLRDLERDVRETRGLLEEMAGRKTGLRIDPAPDAGEERSGEEGAEPRADRRMKQ
jgi:hypothetical protein